MSNECIPKVVSRWAPAGKRKRCRPKTTQPRTIMTELKEMILSWGEDKFCQKHPAPFLHNINILEKNI